MHENSVTHSRPIKSPKGGGVGGMLRFSTFVGLVGIFFVLFCWAFALNFR